MRETLQTAARVVWEAHGQAAAARFCAENAGQAEQRGQPEVAHHWREILQEVHAQIRRSL